MSDRQTIVETLIACCSNSPKKLAILKAVRKKKDYKEVAAELGANKFYCSSVLNELEVNGLVDRKNGTYQMKPLVKRLNLDSIIRATKKEKEKSIRIIRRPRKISTDSIKKELRTYLETDYEVVKHPFDPTQIEKITKEGLAKAVDKFIETLELKVDNFRIAGLHLRFLQAVSDYFNVPRTKKIELTNSFSNLVKMFEPFMKKLAFVKTNDEKWINHSLNESLIKTLIPTFNAKIDNPKPDYWKKRSVLEASFRVVYPYRHIESHEARDYHVFEMERIIHYFWASIIFACIEQTRNS